MSSRKKLLASFLLATVLTASNSLNYSNTDINIKALENTIDINFLTLREAMVNDSEEVKLLNEQIKSLSESIKDFDAMVKYPLIMDPYISGGKEDKKGQYYEYAYPLFVQIEHLRAQLKELTFSKDLIEARLNFASDSAFSNHRLLLTQLDRYNKMVEKTETLFKNIQKKYSLGAISKMKHDASKIELDNLKLERDKISYQLENSKLHLMSSAGLLINTPYKITFPVYSDYNFQEKFFLDYYNDALSSNRKLQVSQAQTAALENEQKYISLFKSYILNSDLLDFEKRWHENQMVAHSSKLNVYKSLNKEFKLYKEILNALQISKDQAAYDKHYLTNLKILEEKGQLVDTERLNYEIKIFQSEIQQLKLSNDKLMQGLKLQWLIFNGMTL